MHPLANAAGRSRSPQVRPILGLRLDFGFDSSFFGSGPRSAPEQSRPARCVHLLLLPSPSAATSFSRIGSVEARKNAAIGLMRISVACQ